MTSNRLSLGSKLATVIAVTLAVLVVAYVIWAFYRVYVFGPSEHGRNEASFSWSNVIFTTIILIAAAATLSLSRLVIRRLTGHSSSLKAIYLLAAPLVILPILVALVSPTTMVFSIVSLLLLFLNLLFGRSSKPVSTTGELLPEAEKL